jgi:protein-S-isoprenylcysteine O-methyltransferase Ste14
MAWVALALDAAFLLLAFGLRTWLAWRSTGDTGWRLGPGHRPAERIASGCVALAVVLSGVAPVVTLVSGGRVVPAAVAVLGVAAAVGAIVVVVVAQLQMGASWRIGLDPGERTALVTAGLYRWVRNPIYTGIGLFVVGLVLMVPNVISIAALVVVVIGVEVQVRLVEEPYLRGMHGGVFTAWAGATGRFAPFVGRGA